MYVMHVCYVMHVLCMRGTHVCYACVCVRIHLIVHNRAIRPCHPSHSMPLALILPRGRQLHLLRKCLIRRDKGDTLSPWVPCAFPPASLLFSRLYGLATTELTLVFVFFFSFHPSLPRFPHRVYTSCAACCASSPLFRPPRSRPRSRSHPSPRSHLHCYTAMILLSFPSPPPFPFPS